MTTLELIAENRACLVEQLKTPVWLCAWCRRWYSSESYINAPENPEPISHGICWSCLKEQKQQISRAASKVGESSSIHTATPVAVRV